MTKERVGELLIFTEATLWSLFPILAVLSQDKLSPLIALGFSTLFSCIFFGLVITFKKQWQALKNTAALKDILIATVILGVLYYILSFFGLRFTSPGNASIIGLSEIFFSYLLFHLWQKDDLPKDHLIGSILVVLGVVIIFYPSIKSFQIGDLLILAAAFIAPFGNFFQKRARVKVSSEIIMFIRSFISTILIFSLAFLLGNTFSTFDLSNVFVFLLINGVLILGFSKILWIEGIHRINVMKANSLAAIAPLLTLFFVWLFMQKAPTSYQLFSFIPMFFGVIFLSKNRKI